MKILKKRIVFTYYPIIAPFNVINLVYVNQMLVNGEHNILIKVVQNFIGGERLTCV